MVQAILDQGVTEKGFPGAVCAYLDTDGHACECHAGRMTFDAASPGITWNTYFDLASLTKVLATTPLCFDAVSRGLLRLDTTVEEVLPGAGAGDATVWHLLTHSSGLPPYDHPLASAGYSPEETRERVLAIRPTSPAGETTAYSCLGFIVLATMLEKMYGADLDQLFSTVVKPLTGLPSAAYGPPPLGKDVAPTDPNLPRGVVHDPMARALGGVSGNAGLFGTIDDLVAAAAWWLDGNPEKALWVQRATTSSTRALGWDTKSAEGSSAGTLYGPNSFGHTGYTGTSLWIDPDAKSYVALLTNRVYPDDSSNAIVNLRPEVANATRREHKY